MRDHVGVAIHAQALLEQGLGDHTGIRHGQRLYLGGHAPVSARILLRSKSYRGSLKRQRCSWRRHGIGSVSEARASLVLVIRARRVRRHCPGR